MSNKKQALESTIYHLCNKSSNGFYGALLQCLGIKFTTLVPTAAIAYNKEKDLFEMLLNEEFFCSFKLETRAAILQHELLHFTNKHIFRFSLMSPSKDNQQLFNIAADMAINQYIKDLPEGGVDVVNFKHTVTLSDGTKSLQPFPTFKSMEIYYELLKNNKEENKKSLDEFKPMDEHIWDQLDDETKEKMMSEAKKTIKRAVEKVEHSHSKIPDSIKDLLEELDVLTATLNYKRILKQTIKRTVSTADRDSTWKRPNKRYGITSPGSKLGSLPKLAFFNDSSGSISVTEQNEYLRIMDEFLKVGVRSCTLGFWHTNLYLKKPYKRGQEIVANEIQSGGTDVGCVLEDIKKNDYNLSIILTDGYFSDVDIKLNNEVIWIISKGGNVDHPLKRIGKTILLDNLK